MDLIHIYELGSGCGFLAINFLRCLKSCDPELYKRTRLHVTDIESKTIELLKKNTAFLEHKNVVFIEQLDASEITELEHKPLFVFSTYLLDTFPCHHLSLKNGVLEEILVETYCQPESWIIETSQYPPNIITPSSALSQFLSGETNGQSLIPIIEERYSPSSDLSFLSKHEKAVITDIFPKQGSYHFNWTETYQKHLASIVKLLDDGGCYLFSDFGLTQIMEIPTPEHLIASYGLTVFSSIPFTLIKNYLSSMPVDVIHSSHYLDQTQDFLIYKGEIMPNSLVKTFESHLMDEVGDEKLAKTLESLQKISPNDPDYAELVNQELLSLQNPKASKDYSFLKILCTQLLHDGEIDLAEYYANIMIDTYGCYAIDAFLILSMVAEQRKNYPAIINYLEPIASLAPYHYMILSLLSVAFLHQRKYDLSITTIKKALSYPHETNTFWMLLVNLLSMFEKMNAISEYKNLKIWLETIQNNYNIIPKQFHNALK